MAENDEKSLEDNRQYEPDEFTSEFSHLYKNKAKADSLLSQQERREIFLEAQKEKRHNVVDKHRNLSELFLEDDSIEMYEESQVSEEMEVETQRPRKSKNKFALMHSEWLTEVPQDLEENWLVKLCPEGFRVLVIAKKFRTVVLNERGKVLTLKTNFPGGGLGKISGLTVLDCIYNKCSKTIFVLDCLYWNTMSMIDSETTFRFYWLKNQFDENIKLSETNKPYKFHLLNFFPAEKSLIQEKVFENLLNVLFTGIVFYHKELQYDFVQTPLFGWLYTYMLPEKLGIDVPKEVMDKMPNDYECLDKYLETLKDKKEKRGRNYFRDRRHEKKKMDTS